MPDSSSTRSAAPPVWSLDMRGTTAPALVEIRRWASRTLTRVDDDHLGDVLLVTTELVTNAYDHGHGPLQVRMSHTSAPCRVRIEVDDNSTVHPVLATSSPERPGGRGMLIVDKIAHAWGVIDRAAGSKTVWADSAGGERTGRAIVTPSRYGTLRQPGCAASGRPFGQLAFEDLCELRLRADPPPPQCGEQRHEARDHAHHEHAGGSVGDRHRDHDGEQPQQRPPSPPLLAPVPWTIGHHPEQRLAHAHLIVLHGVGVTSAARVTIRSHTSSDCSPISTIELLLHALTTPPCHSDHPGGSATLRLGSAIETAARCNEFQPGLEQRTRRRIARIPPPACVTGKAHTGRRRGPPQPGEFPEANAPAKVSRRVRRLRGSPLRTSSSLDIHSGSSV